VSSGFDGNGAADIFTWSAAQGFTLVSRAAFVQIVTGNSYSTSVSADGRYTVFTSTATNLVPNQVTTNDNENIFLYDNQFGTVGLVNHVPGLPDTTGDGGIDGTYGQRPPLSEQPVIGSDGSTIAFYSVDDNLVPN
jgi:hypothetical protein